jgi:apolipoprotein N-acyltransferase
VADSQTAYFNSVIGIPARRAPAYRYDKHHLVPFGEFIPLGFRWFVNLMSIPLATRPAAPTSSPPFPFKDQRVLPNICYEDLFGEEIAASCTSPAPARSRPPCC